MHDTSREIGRKFFDIYLKTPSPIIVEIGSFNVNGSLRDCCPADATYLGLDFEHGPGVDIAIKPKEPCRCGPNSRTPSYRPPKWSTMRAFGPRFLNSRAFCGGMGSCISTLLRTGAFIGIRPIAGASTRIAAKRWRNGRAKTDALWFSSSRSSPSA